MPASSDGHSRDYLLALLAVVNGLVDAETISVAFRQWQENKARPLGEYLVERGAITRGQAERLTHQVNSEITNHGGDPGRCTFKLYQQLRAEDRTALGSIEGDSLVTKVGTQSFLGSMKEAGLLADTSQAISPDDSTIDSSSGVSGPLPPAGARFTIGEFHRGGGMGQIHEAMDKEFNRKVAYKQLKPKCANNEARIKRFILEAEITGKLEHPGVVPAYSFGTGTDSQPFYAMRFVKGRELKDHLDEFHAGTDSHGIRQPANLDEKSRGLRELLRHYVSICQTLAYVHKKGVIHRDLKPSNIMLGDYGETLLIDWGLARAAGRPLPEELDPDLSIFEPSSGWAEQTRGIAGTPGYMAPEQFAGNGGEITAASDIYASGVVLYEILTGRGPFHFQKSSGNLEWLKEATLRGDFLSPREVNPSVPRPLDAICCKAMSLNPRDRYPSAEALAEEIKRWQDDEPVEALPETWRSRLARWERRHRNAVRVGTVGLGVLAVFTTLAALLLAMLNANVRSARNDADKNAIQAKLERNQAIKIVTESRSLLDGFQAQSEGSASSVILTLSTRLDMVNRSLEALQKLRNYTPDDQEIQNGLARASAIRSSLSLMKNEPVEKWESRYKTALTDASHALFLTSLDEPKTDAELAGPPLHALLLLNRAGLYMENDRDSEARKDVSEALKELEEDLESNTLVRAVSHRLLGELELKQGNLEEAAKLWDEAKNEMKPALEAQNEGFKVSAEIEYVRILLQQANLAELKRDPEEQAKLLKEAVTLSNDLVLRNETNLDANLLKFQAMAHQHALPGYKISAEEKNERRNTYSRLSWVINGDRANIGLYLPFLEALNCYAVSALDREDPVNFQFYLGGADTLLKSLKETRPPSAALLIEQARTCYLMGRAALQAQQFDRAKEFLDGANQARVQYLEKYPGAPRPPVFDEIIRDATL